MKGIVVLFFVAVSGMAHGQFCTVSDQHFKPGEQLNYQVYYHFGFIWVSAGWARFSTQLSEYQNKKALHFKSSGQSYPKWDWMYKVNDTYESIVDFKTLSPLYFSRDVHENTLKRKEQYFFNTTQKTIKTKVLEQDSKVWKEKTVVMDKCMFDPLSMIYYARCIPFEHYKKNQLIPLNLFIDGEVHEIFIRYLGKEKKEIKNKGVYNTLKFSALLVEGTIFKGGEGMTVWVSDDQNRVPLLIESEVLVGEILVVMDEIKGLKYTSTSKVE